MGLAIHGRHARVFGQILSRFLARFLTRVFGQGFADRKYSFTIPLGRSNAVLQVYWFGEVICTFTVLPRLRRNTYVVKVPCIKNYIYKKHHVLNIPCLQNLTVVSQADSEDSDPVRNLWVIFSRRFALFPSQSALPALNNCENTSFRACSN